MFSQGTLKFSCASVLAFCHFNVTLWDILLRRFICSRLSDLHLFEAGFNHNRICCIFRCFCSNARNCVEQTSSTSRTFQRSGLPPWNCPCRCFWLSLEKLEDTPDCLQVTHFLWSFIYFQNGQNITRIETEKKHLFLSSSIGISFPWPVLPRQYTLK